MEKVPETWDELLDAGEKLKAIDKYLLTVSCSGSEVDDYYLPFLWQAGGTVCERDENGEWVGKMNSPESLEAAKFYVDLVNQGYMPKEITGLDAEAALNSFTAGDTAMIVTGMWNIANLKGMEEMDGKWATAQMWEGPGGKAVLSYPNTVHITADSENKEMAGKFLNSSITKDIMMNIQRQAVYSALQRISKIQNMPRMRCWLRLSQMLSMERTVRHTASMRNSAPCI